MLHPYEIEKRLELALMAEYVTPMEMRKEIAKLEWQLECCLWMRVEEEMFDPEGTGERAPEEQWKEWMEETWSRVCRACNICRECDVCELMWIPRFFQFTGFWDSNSGPWGDELDDDDDVQSLPGGNADLCAKDFKTSPVASMSDPTLKFSLG